MKFIFQYLKGCCFILLLVANPLFNSCKKFVDINPPETQIETSKIFENDQSAISSIAGLYQRLLTNSLLICNGGMTVYAGLSADELFNTNSGIDDEFSTNSLLSTNGSISGNLWQAAYKNIYNANSILEGLNNSPINELLKKQLKGESLVVRALNYFYLINLFGEVPLVITTSYEENQIMSRTPVTQVYEQIVTDLSEAKNLLTSSYPTSGRVRPNKFTATALLARVYLYLKNWVRAEAQSTEIINSGSYSLPGDIDKVFLANSSETIWSLIQDKANTAEGQIFIPSFTPSTPNYILTDTLLNSFEASDQRKTKWITSTSMNGITFFYPYKYKQGDDFSSSPPPPSEYYIVFRLAEQYLIRAEARAQQENIAGCQADINVIRNRSGLANTIASDKASLLSSIEHERQIELFAEWGHRWLDLKRTNRADQALSTIKGPGWQSTDVIYPIPQTQIQLNPFLTQNPGY